LNVGGFFGEKLCFLKGCIWIKSILTIFFVSHETRKKII
jgi:hypothetical protein